MNEEQGRHVLGAQGNVWTEYMSNPKKVEYMIFPRMSALSEVLWSKKENRDWKDFEKRLMGQFKRYDLWKANYSKAYFDLKATVLPTEDYNGVLWKLESKLPHIRIEVEAPIKYLIDDTVAIFDEKDPSRITGTKPIINLTNYFTYENPVLITKSGKYSSSIVLSEAYERTRRLPGIKQEFHFTKATGKKLPLQILLHKIIPVMEHLRW